MVILLYFIKVTSVVHVNLNNTVIKQNSVFLLDVIKYLILNS